MEKTLIFAVQVCKQFVDVLNVHLDSRRKNIRVISCLTCFFLLIDLHSFNRRQLLLDEFECVDLIQRLNVNVDTE